MESVQERTNDQVLWPNHICGLDGETTAKPGQPNPRQIWREDKEEFESSTVGNSVVLLRDDGNVHCIWGMGRHVRHHVDQCVLFNVPRAGVKRELSTPEPPRKLVYRVWEDQGEKLAEGVREQGQGLSKEQCARISKREVHIRCTAADGQECSDLDHEERETHVAMEIRIKPMIHTRKVLAGIIGSSMFDTAARTSAKGLSSSEYSKRKSSSYLNHVSCTGARKAGTKRTLYCFPLYPAFQIPSALR